MKAFISSYLY